MKKLLILLASCAPMGIVAALFDYQAAVLKNDYLGKELFRTTYIPISLYRHQEKSRPGYASREQWLNADFEIHSDSSNGLTWKKLPDGRFVDNTHGEYHVKLSDKRDALVVTYNTQQSWNINLNNSFTDRTIPCCFKVGEKFYCFFYPIKKLTDDSQIPHCVSFLVSSLSAVDEELAPFNGMLVPKSLLATEHQKADSSLENNFDVPKRIIALGKKIYFLGEGTPKGSPLCDEKGKSVYISSPNIALSHDNSRIAYIDGTGAQTALVITDGEKQHTAPLASWRNRFAAMLPFSVSFLRSLSITPLHMRVSGRWYCYFDANGAVHVGPSTSGKEEFVVAPKPAAASWRNWSGWQWALPTTAALLGLGALWKTNGWKKAFSR